MRRTVRFEFTLGSAFSGASGPDRGFAVSVLAIVCAAALAAGCRTTHVPSSSLGPTTSAPPTTVTVPAPPPTAQVAYPRGNSVSVFPSPGAAQPVILLPNPWMLNGVSNEPIPQAFLVLQSRPDGWVQVLLPSRPNGSAGWIPPGSAQLLADPYRIEVSLHDHRVVVARYGTTVYSGPAATGAASTPTPTGLFYVRVLLHTANPRSPYGPYAYGLSAHSEALDTFDGGDAEIGVHGNNNPSLLGLSVTHGCVRMDNAEVSQLASVLPLGTPVRISA